MFSGFQMDLVNSFAIDYVCDGIDVQNPFAFGWMVGILAVLFNLYGPRAECDDTERIQFKLTYFKILQVTQIVSLSIGLTVNGSGFCLHSGMKKHALDFYFLWLHYWRGEYWCLYDFSFWVSVWSYLLTMKNADQLTHMEQINQGW